MNEDLELKVALIAKALGLKFVRFEDGELKVYKKLDDIPLGATVEDVDYIQDEINDIRSRAAE